MADDLNPQQREAVTTLAGPLLVLAGAGTGKTRVVTYRIAALVKRGTRPSRILAVTFTNKAATEMQQRAAALLGRRSAERPEISTFHSLCVRVLRRHARRLGYPEQFAIYDRGDQEGLARAALREIKVGDQLLRPGDLVNMISRWKTQSVRPEQAASLAQTDKQHLASMAYRRYQQALRTAGAVDFDDLLLCTEELFAEHDDARRTEAARFDHVLIDEYQDTNVSQYRIVKGLAAGHRNLCVVGDDDQSIYGWRGAEVSHILRFKVDWPDAKVVRLEENYRSTAAILELANCLIAYNNQRHPKNLRAARPGGERPQIWQCADETNEARKVVEDIRARLNDPRCRPRDFAILLRTNEQPRPFEVELRRAKLPYVLVGGMSFYDRKEVRDVLAYLKLLVAPGDEIALRRVLNTPARGIGQRAIERLTAEAVARGRPLWDTLGVADTLTDLNPLAAQAARQFRELVSRFQRRLASGDAPLEVASSLIAEIGYQDELARLYKDPIEQQARWAAVEDVVNALGAFQKRAARPTMAAFLDEIALGDRDNQDKDSQLSRDAIALMTLHSAKGLEFSHVYLAGLEEGLLPHRRSLDLDGRAIDEERRLCYVGVTRAQDRLTITLALSRLKWGKPRPTQPSRFLFEMTGQADRPTNPARRASAEAAKRAAIPRSDGRTAGTVPPREVRAAGLQSARRDRGRSRGGRPPSK